jgi:hypothetical protein
VASSVKYDDLELFLTGWFRERLAARPESYCQGFVVDNKEPAGSFPARLLVVRFDGRTRSSVVSGEASVGLSVLAGTKTSPKDANDAAEMVLALAESLPAVEPGNPVAALVSSAGPFPVVEAQDRARRYMTLDLVVAGLPL